MEKRIENILGTDDFMLTKKENGSYELTLKVVVDECQKNIWKGQYKSEAELEKAILSKNLNLHPTGAIEMGC
jgi:hypothetical protein